MSNGTKIGRKPTNIYFQWYLRYIRHRLDRIPRLLLALIPPDVETQQSSPLENHQKALGILTAIANLLGSEHDLALSEILKKLEHQGLLLPRAELRPQGFQLIFIAVGLLTFFYDPVLEPEDEALQILGPEKAEPKVSRNATWISYSQDMSHVDQPIVTLIRQFGGVKGPIPRAVINEVDITSTLKSTLEPLTSLNLSYFTLTRVAQISIEWVSSVCLHLEFDMRRKVLKLFRFPSLCGLLCDKVVDTTYLSLYSDLIPSQPHILTQTKRFFDDYFADDSGVERIAAPSAQFYREIIQSYRILFGQDKHSWKAFTADHGRKFFTPLADAGEDPLLPSLCGDEWLKQEIYEDIDVSSVKTVYSARADFPFFADRLLSLQDFAVMQCPSDWRTVWWDRRDVARFWTLWAVMVFGGASIVIGIIQVVLAVAQVIAAYQAIPRGPEL